MKSRNSIIKLCVLVSLSIVVFGESAVPLAAKIGDPAAPLQVSEWIKGGPITLAEGKDKTVYVVEFWATWCPPCKESIPHLTKLQAEYKDRGVVFVGITDEKPKIVKPFVKKMDAKMEYVVGVDDTGKTSEAYMTAYRQEGIPTAFVIDKAGAVVWVGHPSKLDRVLEHVVTGKFVPKPLPPVAEADAADEEEDSKLDQYFEQARLYSGKAAAVEIGETLLKQEDIEPDDLNTLASQILTDNTLVHPDYPLALGASRLAFEKTEGKQCDIVDSYARALFMNGKTNEAVAMQQKAISLCDDSKTRLELKETLADYQHPAPKRGLTDAERIKHFTTEALALMEARRTVPVDQMLTKIELGPCKVTPMRPSTLPLASEEICERYQQSVLVVGTLTKSDETGDWDLSLAAGFIIHESGIFVTNFHVLNKDATLFAAMTADGRVYPIKSVLAVSPFPDIAICQLDGAAGLKPLPLKPDAKPGSHIRILSHPNNAFYSLTEGILSRYFVNSEGGKSTTMLTTTADFAIGASGGPLFDDCGNVVGMVSATSSVYTEESEDAQLQMVLKMCVPSSEILKLLITF